MNATLATIPYQPRFLLCRAVAELNDANRRVMAFLVARGTEAAAVEAERVAPIVAAARKQLAKIRAAAPEGVDFAALLVEAAEAHRGELDGFRPMFSSPGL